MVKAIDGERKTFMTGNEVCTWAALAAGAKILYGYPITPQNEIMHWWARLMGEYERDFLQTEDELSAGFAMFGGLLSGVKCFSATAGPGNVLMQEPISMAEMMRLPGVWIIQQRGGPSTATVIYSQQETRLTAFGGNGEGMRIVYSTAGNQDLFDYVIKAFCVAWKYRFPTFVLADGYQAKMREPVTLYDAESRGVDTGQAEPFLLGPGVPAVDRDPVHLRNTYNVEEELYQVVSEHVAAYNDMTDKVCEYSQGHCEDADIIIISHGIVSRSAKEAVKIGRSQGEKIGYFRPVTIRPFPSEELKMAIKKGQKLLVAESSYGQLMSMVKDSLYGLDNEIYGLLKPGLGITSEDIMEEVEQIKGKKASGVAFAH